MQTLRYLSLFLLLSGTIGAYAAPAKSAKAAAQAKEEIKQVPQKPSKKKKQKPTQQTDIPEAKPAHVIEEPRIEPVVEIKVEAQAEEVHQDAKKAPKKKKPSNVQQTEAPEAAPAQVTEEPRIELVVEVEAPAPDEKPIVTEIPAEIKEEPVVETVTQAEEVEVTPEPEQALEDAAQAHPALTDEEAVEYEEFVDTLQVVITEALEDAICDSDVAFKYAQLNPEATYNFKVVLKASDVNCSE